jgi:hypothetical protein
MTLAIHNRKERSLSRQRSESEQGIASLVVRLYRDERSCIAYFSGALTEKTRATIDGIADLIVGEVSLVFDFSRIDVVDRGGADAVDVLIRSVRLRGAHLKMAH